jgi:hypothetical protein
MNSPGNDGRSSPHKAETTLVTAGRDTKAQKGFVNPDKRCRRPGDDRRPSSPILRRRIKHGEPWTTGGRL